MPKVLLISSNEDFKTDLNEQISQNIPGFEVIFNDQENSIFDIIIVDENVSELNKVHQKYLNTPLYFLSSIASTGEFISIKKPLHLPTFLDELRSCLSKFANSENSSIEFSNYCLKLGPKEIVNLQSNVVTKLTAMEVAIITYLYKADGRVVGKAELLKEVWGYNEDTSTHTIETHIYRLRQKVEGDNPSSPIVETLDGGYKLA